MVEGCALGAVGEESGFFVSGASNPRSRRDMSLRAVMNFADGGGGYQPFAAVCASVEPHLSEFGRVAGG